MLIGTARNIKRKIWRAIKKHANLGYDYLTDKRLGIDTYFPLSHKPHDPSDPAAVGEPLHYSSIKIIFNSLKPTKEDVIYDVGCGKGRIISFLARRAVRKCVGVELIAPLGETARQNLARLRSPETPADVIIGDAVTQNYDEATIILMYNPFSIAVVRPFLKTIKDSLARRPRKLRFAYANPVASRAFDECSWLHKTDSFKVPYGGGYMEVCIYSADPAP